MPPSAGMRFSRYELLSRLGAGGMGEVWRARDHDLHRDVAIKFLPEKYAADPNRFGRFGQEALAASRLTHPNIVTIHEVGETSGLHFIVMELVEGETLREILLAQGERPLPVRRLLDIGAQVAEGLAKAHGAGIVHRDLKPENIMVTADGFVKVLDFGLAKLRAEGSGGHAQWFDSAAPTWPESPSPQTAVGAVLGTAGYMSPEQARGRPVDYRSDQFTLGAIVYEMATGRQAFRRETPVQTIAAIIEDPPEPLASLSPGLPAPVRWLIERCLAKEPAERYASTLDLARELRTVREHLTDGTSSHDAPSGERSSSARRASAVVRVAIVLLAALGVGAGALVLSPSLRDRLVVALKLRPVPREKGIAVLPFRAASPEPGDRHRADGLAETLAARLSQLERFHGSLWVVPASEVRQSGVDSAEAARRAFGVTLVVTGSLQRLGDRLRLTASLVDALDLRPLRSLGPTEYAADDLSLQDRLAAEVARMLDLSLSPAEQEALRSGGTTVGAAYPIYLEAQGHLQRYDQTESLERAVSLFQQALQRDPEYALAYAGLAEAQWLLYRQTRGSERVDLARRACERALKLNDLLAPVHVTLGIIHAGTGQAEKALADFDRALALDPVDADALRAKARAYEALGRPGDAEAALRKAVELHPAYWGTRSQLGAFYFRQGRYGEAERAFRQALALTPDNVRVLASLGGVLQTAGRDEEAAAALERSLALQPTYRAASNLGVLEFKRGRYAEAAHAFERALALDDHDFRVWRNLAAAYHWAPGQQEKARPAWEKAARLAEEAARVNPKDAAVVAELASCRAMLGDTARARADLARALALAPGDVEVQQLAASVYELIGDRASALVWIRRALAAGYPRDQVEQDPFLTALRGDPRFPREGAGSPRTSSD